MSSDLPDTRATLARLQQLPPLPAIAQQLLRHLHDDQLSMDRLADLIAQDPSITAKLIGVANSAFSSPQRAILTIPQAIMRIGLDNLRALCLGIVLGDMFPTRRCPAFDLQRYWVESLSVAQTCQVVAAYWDPPLSKDLLYLIGLLHNLGIYALTALYPERMQVCLQSRTRDTDARLQDCCITQFGLGYYAAAGLLLTQWGLPLTVRKLFMALDTPPHQVDEALQPTLLVLQHVIAWRRQGYNAYDIPHPLRYLTAERQAQLAATCQNSHEEASYLSQHIAAYHLR